MKPRNLIILFLIGIYGFALFSVVKKPVSFSENENRYLAQCPKVRLSGILDGTFSEEYEAYVTDQFAFRDQWIAVKTMSERVLQKEDINGVYFGKDGYLMEKFDYDTFETELAEKNIAKLGEFTEKYAKKLGNSHVQVLLVPTASEVLTDKLPVLAAPYPQEVFLRRVEQAVGTECFVNGKTLLQQHAQEEIYYRTDHHWTTLAAFYAYQNWAQKIGVQPWTADEFKIIPITEEFYGTLNSKVNLKRKPDSISLYLPKQVERYQLFRDGEEKSIETLYEDSALDEKDKYSVFLGGNYGLIEIDTEQENGKKLLIIKDSFAHCFAPFAVNHFESTYLVDFRYFNTGIADFIEKKQITDILVLYNTANLATDRNIYKITR